MAPARPALIFTPLWPAGHLPHKGGDQQISLPAHISGGGNSSGVEVLLRHCDNVISPLVGEMAGRPEGGAFTLPAAP